MRQTIKEAETIVIKMGTTSVTHANGTLNLKKLDQLARVLTDLENSGRKMVLVSSGAIGCGMNRLGLKERPTTLEAKQATASVGQGLLMEIYHKFFDEYHQNVGQILLTKDVFKHSIKRSNAINTFKALKNRNIIPIVNENDCIATDEIQEECFGDNDILSAMTADIVEADLLIILSDVDGLYDSNPNENEDARLLQTVEVIDSDILGSAGSSTSGLGTGGMVTKIGAAKYATDRGIDTIIASGEDVKVIYDILEGNEIGTFFIKQDLQEVQNVKKSND
ncbi:glutamate 5-kinase [Eubacterium sp. 1001713B170207_170306_E7]|uniref:glutamate 5-kinase n=1 Tax=Eubacterium sp. 1001713B170207_170306_E7 TaxID=2787097 RepID=UPI00189AA1D8|nr:glutamate 5-kinase [Eubacterium sp. 1001713B170207_170306_E7]